jgi:hypothetical protein
MAAGRNSIVKGNVCDLHVQIQWEHLSTMEETGRALDPWRQINTRMEDIATERRRNSKCRTERPLKAISRIPVAEEYYQAHAHRSTEHEQRAGVGISCEVLG